jgi:hypothetical protein
VRILLSLLSVIPLAPAHLGSGDSVQPRDTESVIESVVPVLPAGVTVQIVGFDTFVRLSALGHAVMVPGYEDEPYIKIESDGDVFVNDGSATAVLNGDRYGNVDLRNFVRTAEPEWRRVATNGEMMWHDHRSHWMSPKRPAVIDEKGTVQDFVIPITIDGQVTQIAGAMYLRGKASSAWWLLGALGVVGAVLLSIARRRLFLLVIPVVAFCAMAVGAAEFLGLPPGVRITPVLLLFGAGALAVSLAAVWFSARRSSEGELFAVSLNAGAGTTMLVTVWMCVEQVRSAYVPGLEWAWMARALIPIMLGVGLVATIDGVTRAVRGTPA